MSHPVLTSSLSVLLSFIETEGRRGESISTLVSHPVLSLVSVSFSRSSRRRADEESFWVCQATSGLLITPLRIGRDLRSCWPLSINTNSVHSRLEIIARCGWFIWEVVFSRLQKFFVSVVFFHRALRRLFLRNSISFYHLCVLVTQILSLMHYVVYV